MSAAKAAWVFFRLLKWGLFLGFLFCMFYFSVYRASVVTSFGHLPMHLEVLIFGLGVGAGLAGLLEMMMREQAGVPRPDALRWSATPPTVRH